MRSTHPHAHSRHPRAGIDPSGAGRLGFAGGTPGGPALTDRRESWTIAILLGVTLALRLVGLDQPIVENYVGRQVPTAMVARNLARGSGLLRPQLDTGPFPNLFLVEPPLYQAIVVGLARATGLPLDWAGRAVSAFGWTLAAWGLYGMVRRRGEPEVAAISVLAFAVFPVGLRYGRAFQPDALMLGCVVAGLRCHDEATHGGRTIRGLAGVALLALGLALKVISAIVVVPLLLLIEPSRRRAAIVAAVALLPALAWYAYAAFTLRRGEGSLAAADNGALWLRALVPSALLELRFYSLAIRFLVIRSFTPIGFILGLAGIVWDRRADRVPVVWFLSAAAMLMLVAGKAHHEYYWIALAPPLAWGFARGVEAIVGHHGWRLGASLVGMLAVMGAAQARGTFRTPREWACLPAAATDVRSHVPPDALLVAPEALLYFADRRGCRLETGLDASRRAAGEWRGRIDQDGPLGLVAFYRTRGAQFFADLAEPCGDPGRHDVRAAVRREYRVIVDRPGLLLAELVPAGVRADAR
jgi:4-amino-4-deoxy-L-arabinose transferase-like glycosyltransferase